jgi:hypothetical protein
MIMQSAEGHVHARWQRAWTSLFRKSMTFVQDTGDTPAPPANFA